MKREFSTYALQKLKAFLQIFFYSPLKVFLRAALLFVFAAASVNAYANIEQTLHSFAGSEGAAPKQSLVLGGDGNFYGTTQYGGAKGLGTIFVVTSAGVVTTLHSFNGSDGALPASVLTLGADGSFYGVAQRGGAKKFGALYKITAAGVFTTLYDFQGGLTGITPEMVVQGSDGTLYGITSSGGANGRGVAFKLTSDGTYSVIYTFSGNDGSQPNTLMLANDGKLYGTTASGGTNNFGTVFQLTTSGALAMLHSFNGSDGYGPAGKARLIQATDGSFYGATNGGGAFNAGTLFKISSSGTFTLLSSMGQSEISSGQYPSGLVQGPDGNFYGTAFSGGKGNYGVVFQLTSAGAVSTIYQFNGPDASGPGAPLVVGSDGNLYGTSYSGGDHSQGTIFKITVNGGGSAGGTCLAGSGASQSSGGPIVQLHSFGCVDGTNPSGALTQGADGNFYGTTERGGSLDQGTIFKITPAGVLTTLHTFGGSAGDGTFPLAKLTLGSDGAFYGTTYTGGVNDQGTVFRLSPAGALTILHSFNVSDGQGVEGDLLQGTDGNFYGLTTYGGSADGGTIFKISPTGVFEVLYSLGSGSGDGTHPAYGGLRQASNGNLYGTTQQGGAYGLGTVFTVTQSGSYTTLYSFGQPGTFGNSPTTALTLGADGNFYGTTTGTIFKITPAGVLTTVFDFSVDTSYGAASNPSAALLLASDGNFYGTTIYGGKNGRGTVFRFKPTGELNVFASFDGENGDQPHELIQGTDGSLYGTSTLGGASSHGTIFKLSRPHGGGGPMAPLTLLGLAAAALIRRRRLNR